MTPCRNCGGPKPPGRGVKLCHACKTLLYYENGTKRDRIDQKGRVTRPLSSCCRCGGPKVPDGQKATRGQKLCAECKPFSKTSGEYTPRKRKPKILKPVKVKTPRERKPEMVIPKEIRAAWGRAGHGSQFKRLCPTLKDLEKRYGQIT